MRDKDEEISLSRDNQNRVSYCQIGQGWELQDNYVGNGNCRIFMSEITAKGACADSEHCHLFCHSVPPVTHHFTHGWRENSGIDSQPVQHSECNRSDLRL